MHPSKRKGDRVEREVVNALKAEGFEAQRTLLPAQAGRQNPGDLVVEGMRAEVKARGNGCGFSTLRKWLGENDILFLKQDRASPFVAMTWDTFVWLMKGRGK